MKIKIREFESSITAEELRIGAEEGTMEFDFDGALKVKLLKRGTKFIVSNAMNGHGNNCREEFKNEPVIISE